MNALVVLSALVALVGAAPSGLLHGALLRGSLGAPALRLASVHGIGRAHAYSSSSIHPVGGTVIAAGAPAQVIEVGGPAVIDTSATELGIAAASSGAPAVELGLGIAAGGAPVISSNAAGLGIAAVPGSPVIGAPGHAVALTNMNAAVPAAVPDNGFSPGLQSLVRKTAVAAAGRPVTVVQPHITRTEPEIFHTVENVPVPVPKPVAVPRPVPVPHPVPVTPVIETTEVVQPVVQPVVHETVTAVHTSSHTGAAVVAGGPVGIAAGGAIAAGPAVIGAGPAGLATGGAIAAGPAVIAAGPAVIGAGPAVIGAGPAGLAAGPAGLAAGPAILAGGGVAAPAIARAAIGVSHGAIGLARAAHPIGLARAAHPIGLTHGLTGHATILAH